MVVSQKKRDTCAAAYFHVINEQDMCIGEDQTYKPRRGLQPADNGRVAEAIEGNRLVF